MTNQKKVPVILTTLFYFLVALYSRTYKSTVQILEAKSKEIFGSIMELYETGNLHVPIIGNPKLNDSLESLANVLGSCITRANLSVVDAVSYQYSIYTFSTMEDILLTSESRKNHIILQFFLIF